MEGNISSQGGMVSGGASYGGLDLQGSLRVHYRPQQPQNLHPDLHVHGRQGSSAHPCIHEVFSLTMGNVQDCVHSISMAEYNKEERGKTSTSEEDEPSFAEEGNDGHDEGSVCKKGSLWHRVKWTDDMVRLLITAVSYIGEDAAGVNGRRKFAFLQKKGKWKSVSKVMAERGYRVSPQQCEDKFNDLNKRYKRLNDMLGRGTSCQVVENPALLDLIDFLSEKEKEDVKKILSSKHLFYEEMCSYHNGNRLHLPPDPALQRSLQLALRSRDDRDNDDLRRGQHDDFDEDDQDVEHDFRDDFEESHDHGDKRGVYRLAGGCGKKTRQCQVHEDASFVNFLNSSCQPQPSQADRTLPHSTETSRARHLEEQRLHIQIEMLELEKQKLKWQRLSKKKDRELEKFRMENERMKLENERMALELKRKEIGADLN